MKFFKVITYGCQMNLHESEKLAGILSIKGYFPTEDNEQADIIVFNTCCIRENAEQHALGNLGALKYLKKKKPSLIIAMGGCMTQQPGVMEKIKESYPFVDIIFGTHNLDFFGDYLDERLAKKKRVFKVFETDGKIYEGTKVLRTSYPNAWVNIMQGCNNFCTYCIVPYVRGRERSRQPEFIFSEVQKLVLMGYKEITLLGQNVNSYGKDLEGDINFAKLITMLKEVRGNFRLRFMTNHPKDLTEDLVKAVADNPHCAHLIHLPVQAGSDRILKLMNRRYTSQDYINKVELIRKYMPDCAITTDIMVGFPTETEEDFCDTLNLVKKVGFSSAFTFVYSRRKGTVADKMGDQVPEDVKKDRIMRLVDLCNEQTREYSSNYLGKTITVLCEDFDKKKQMYMGRDEYGRMGYFECENNAIGEFCKIKVTSANGISLFGELVDDENQQ